MRWLLLLAACGCDRVLKLDQINPPPPDAGPSCAATPLLVDDFTEPVACAPWGTLGAVGGATASEGNGVLTFQLPPTGNEKCKTASSISLPAGGVLVRIEQAPDGMDSSMSLESASLDAEIYLFDGTLHFGAAGGGGDVATAPYTPAAMKYWRLLPDVANNAVIGSYSPDGGHWTDLPVKKPLATVPMLVDIQIKAGTMSTATQASFSYLLACP